MFSYDKIIDTESTDLHRAVAKRDSKLVKELLDKGADVNAVDKMGCTPIRYAVLLGDVESVKILLEANADVKYQVQPGASTLSKLDFDDLKSQSNPGIEEKTREVALQQSILYIAVHLSAFDESTSQETYIKMLKLLLKHSAAEGCDKETLQDFMIHIMINKGIPEIQAFNKYVKVKLNLEDERIEPKFFLMSQANDDILDYLVEYGIFDREEVIEFLLKRKDLWYGLNKTARMYLDENSENKEVQN